MRVLFAALRWDYKIPDRGDSFEYVNFWGALSRMEGVEARFFGFDEQEARLGGPQMNQALVELARDWRPDLAFFFLFRDEVQPSALAELRSLGIPTLNWFADDHWRFHSFSRHWAPLFNWVVTTDPRAKSRYERDGYERAILSQWGCNHHLYRPTTDEVDIDASFVGQPYGKRRTTIERLERDDLHVQAWGEGWAAGRLESRDLPHIFSRTRINLNFADSSPRYGVRTIAKQFIRRRGPFLLPRVGELRMRYELVHDATRPQIKARNFEISGCGGFVLTQFAEGIEDFYEPGREIGVFHNYRDLCKKMRRYLQDEDERKAIAAAGYERTLREHTYDQRFTRLFKEIGLA